MNLKFLTIIVITGALSASAHAAGKSAQKGTKLTGYECARMERLVVPMAEIIGMDRPGYMDVLEVGKAKSDMPNANDALRGYLIGFKKEVLIRQQYDLREDFTKQCAAGKIRTLD